MSPRPFAWRSPLPWTSPAAWNRAPAKKIQRDCASFDARRCEPAVQARQSRLAAEMESITEGKPTTDKASMSAMQHKPGRMRRALRPLRRALRSGNAGGAARGTGARLRRGARRPDISRRNSIPCCKNFAGRPTPLQFASRLTEHLGGPRIYIKREDLLHTGAHKINNCLGQGLLAVRMGKRRIIAETGAGQHGVATATVAARLGPGMRRVHGHRRHGAPAAQRVPHALAGRRSGRREFRQRARSKTRSTKRCATG